MFVLQKNEITRRSVSVIDIEKQVKPFIKEMMSLCNKQIGRYKGGFAIAHCQVEKENPLTFYVMKSGDAIINPKIISVSDKTLMLHLEGCMSLKIAPEYKVKRYRKIKVEYTLLDGAGVHPVNKNISDMYAFIMQHEIDHFNLKYIDEK
jgi:peptide deformylase